MSCDLVSPCRRYALCDLQESPTLRAALDGRVVRIWSADRQAWWCHEGRGYQTDIEQACKYIFAEAWDYTSHLGPDKDVVLELVD